MLKIPWHFEIEKRRLRLYHAHAVIKDSYMYGHVTRD
jgi:hypothetical protein